MIKAIIISCLMMFSHYHNTVFHGGHVATFSYQIESEHILLEFQIESDVLNHFDLTDACPNYKSARAYCISQYINAHQKFTLDQENIEFELVSSKSNRNTFIVKMIAHVEVLEDQNMLIQNDCFISFDRRFENRIIIRRKNAVRSYLLDHQHQTIHF